MSFPLIGNEKIRLATENAIQSGRFPHALIIDGDTGLGKHTLAEYLSLCLLCGSDTKPCNNCRSCQMAKSKNHPDITIIAPEEKKKNIAVAQIRQLRQDAFIKPHVSNCRVFIIDKAETMNEQSQNALLKILEEPPRGVYFILIAQSAAALLETILSRCVTFSLSPPDREEACRYIAQNIKPKREEGLILKALDEAKGNIGRATELLKKRNSDSAEAAAKEFSRLLIDGEEFEMLCILNRFEKDRPAADVFLSSLKHEIAALVRKNYNDTQKCKALTELYSLTDSFMASLKTNINLALLFTEIVASVKRLCREYL